MAKIKIYKRGEAKVRLGKRQFADALVDIDRRSRVKRPSLTEFFLTGGFAKLPVVSTVVIDNPIRRYDEKPEGYEVPESDLGRVGEATASSAESVRLWIEKNLGKYGIDRATYSVVLED